MTKLAGHGIMYLSKRKGQKQKECMLSYDSKEGEFIMKVAVEREGWYDYKENAWGGAVSTLNEIEAQHKEDEAVEIIEECMSEDILGHIPSEIELEDFIWFDLPDIMHLYDEDDDEDGNNDEDDEEYEDDEEE